MTRSLRSRHLTWIALAAILALAAALRLTGIRYGLPLPVLNPDEGEHRAPRVADGARAPRPGLVRLPVSADGAPRAGAGPLREARPRGGAVRRGRDRARRRCGHVVARPPRLRHRRRDRRRGDGRGRDDARRLLADGRHRRAPDARDDVRARARRRAAHRVGGPRGRPRRVGQVPGCDRGRPGGRGGVGEVAVARPGRAPRGRSGSRSRARSC